MYALMNNENVAYYCMNVLETALIALHWVLGTTKYPNILCEIT